RRARRRPAGSGRGRDAGQRVDLLAAAPAEPLGQLYQAGSARARQDRARPAGAAPDDRDVGRGQGARPRLIRPSGPDGTSCAACPVGGGPTLDNTSVFKSKLIERVQEGMRVIDANGDDIGSVEHLKMGDPEALTTAGNEPTV